MIDLLSNHNCPNRQVHTRKKFSQRKKIVNKPLTIKTHLFKLIKKPGGP